MFVYIFIIFLLIILIILSLIDISKKEIVSPPIITCKECATNVITGDKRCEENITAYLDFEICNPQNSCTNPLTPYALNNDRSTNINGICEEGVACPCVSSPSCPFYTSTVFVGQNGNPYIPDSSFYYKQQIYNGQKGLCTIPFTQLSRAVDYCNITDLNSFIACVDNKTLCLLGNPAVVTDIYDFEYDKLKDYQIGCFNLSSSCSNKTIPVFNQYTGEIECK
jgi:hypothetical protein